MGGFNVKAFKLLLVLLLGFVVLGGCGGGSSTGPLNAPTNLVATAGAGQIVLTWTDNSTAEEGFKIFRKLEADTALPTTALDQVGTDITRYEDKAISSAESYVYSVQAFSSTGEGEFSGLSAPVKATPGANKITLKVERKADGARGVITSDPTGINCVNRGEENPGVCSFDFDKGKVVTLTATPDAGSQFIGWSGACNGLDCIVTLDASKIVTATFAPIANKIVVTKTGDGEGQVTSDTTDKFKIDCGTICEVTSEVETVYGLRAVPASGSVFAGWTNCDAITESGRCSITIGNGKGAEVIARFLQNRPAPTIDELTVCWTESSGEKCTPNQIPPNITEVTVKWRVDDKGSSEPTTLELTDNFRSDCCTYNLAGKGLTDSLTVSLTTDSRTFTLKAKNPFGEATLPVPVSRGSLPTINNFKADKSSIGAGQSVTLSWDALPAGTTLQLEKDPATGDTATVPASGTSQPDSPAVTTVYTLIATNAFGSKRSSPVPVTVIQAPTLANFTATLNSSSTAVTFNWERGGGVPDTLTLNPGNISLSPTATAYTLTPAPSSSQTYTLTATNSAGTAEQQVTVTISTVLPPTITGFTATPNPSPAPSTPITFSWTPGGGAPTTLTLNPGNISVPLDASSYVLTPGPTADETYTLTASNSAGANPTPATVTVTVTPAPPPVPTISFTEPADDTYAVNAVVPLKWTIASNDPLTSLKLNGNELPSVAVREANVTLPATATTTNHILEARNANPTAGTATKPITTGAKPVISNVLVSTPGIGSTDYSVSWDIAGDGTISYVLLDPGGVEVAGITFVGNTFLFTPAGAGDYTLRGSNEYGDTPNEPGIGEAIVPIS
jgi:Divergent InlB B-repeat domain